jgi:hypothetical protein
MTRLARDANAGDPFREITLDDIRPYLTVDVETAGAALGISRASAYAAVQRGATLQPGEIPVLRVGGRLLVPVPRLLELVGYVPGHSDVAPAATGATPNDSNPDQELRHDQRGTPTRPTSSTLRAVTGL